jgi:hypothetical protein
MNTHNSKGELNKSIEADIAHTKFMLKVSRSMIDQSKLEIQTKISDTLRSLEQGADPNTPEIQSVYAEANRERIKELNKRQAITEFEHARNRMSVCAIQSRNANEMLSVSMSKLISLVGVQEAAHIINGLDHEEDAAPDQNNKLNK